MLRINVFVEIRSVSELSSQVAEEESIFDDENYYQILNIPFSYDVDIELVERNYIRLYRALSEEMKRFVGGTQFAENYLAMLNAAKKCLSDDILRAEHFLRLNDKVPTPEQSEDFLKVIFDLHAIEDKEEQKAALSKELEKYRAEMEKAFSADDLDTACSCLSKIKFLVSHYE